MLYFLIESLGWLVIVFLLVIMIVLYIRLHQQLAKLRQNMTQLQDELQQHKDSIRSLTTSHPSQPAPNSIADSLTNSSIANPPVAERADATLVPRTKNKTTPAPIEPDERSLPMVTSLFNSIKNWFLGGNLVVRVGVLVLLVGVVLLLRLLSEYIEVPISLKLAAIGLIGLAIAGLGLKLVAKRFAYGITLQGTGLAIAYLSTFFAYSVYQVISSLPSFIILGVLSAVTVALAVRQNAFPLALLALSGGFFAPILTSADTGSLSALFSYYLLLNVTIAAIAHYRPWKVLNLLGVTVTFGLAYYWGAIENLTTAIDSQRWTLVLLVALHVILYLFVVIRYAQQIIAYNAINETDVNSLNDIDSLSNTAITNNAYLFPIDIGLLFSVPILAFGLFSALLNDITHALTITSAILAAIYLVLGWLFIQRSQRYSLITEGMLALGGGFLALMIPLAFDAEWIAFGWSVQGLALVWFGRCSLRAWSVLFGLLLQLISVGMLINTLTLTADSYPTLALTVSAISYLATMFILRASNVPIYTSSNPNINKNIDTSANEDISQYAKALGVNTQAAQQWLASINSDSIVFQTVWRSPIVIRLLTFAAVAWSLYVLIIDFDQWLASWQLATTTLIAMAALLSLTIYWLINRYRSWSEIRQFNHGLLLVFYLMLILQLPQKFEFNYQWMTAHWLLFAALLIGWLVVGQLWLKAWHTKLNLKGYDIASWLGAGIVVLAEAVHYGLPDSQGVITILVPVALMLTGLWFTHRYHPVQHNTVQSKNATSPLPLYWFNWQSALLGCAKVFVPVTLGWTIFTNWSYNGVIWGLSYFPLINLYDVTLWLVLLYGFGAYYINPQRSNPQQARQISPDLSNNNLSETSGKSNYQVNTADSLLILLALISFWVISSMLVRTLHAFIGTPLWSYEAWGAWHSEQVQTGLTILWTLLALVATIVASRHWQRTLWFMGIGLLGIVVFKLVLVDLSQTEAIWRVISFLGAGSLILLIGYLAPLPPARDDVADKA
nr:DUF2339 domain-containing protein [Psychrobacter frigidicola]